MIERKKGFFPDGVSSPEDAHRLANLFYMFASGRPKQWGVYKLYAAQDLDELIAHYEHDLCEAAEKADAEHLTRLAQALYILKTGEFENIWWRIENRTNELCEEGKLDSYHVINILRAFSRSQGNRMCGQDKTFYRLEHIIEKDLDNISDRDVTHLMYAYSVRNVGNPNLHAAFEKRLELMADKLDYPGMFNAVYYLLFRENANRTIWEKIVSNVVQ